MQPRTTVRGGGGDVTSNVVSFVGNGGVAQMCKV